MAISSAWIIGDRFIRDGFGAYQKLDRKPETQRDKPYLFQYYDVKACTPPNFDTGNGFSRLRNALAQGINDATRMPKMLIFCFDISLLKYTAGEPGTMMLIQWLLSEIKTTIEIWKE